MKNYLIIIIGILFISSCNINNEDNSKRVINRNALLAKKAQVDSRIAFKNYDNPEWVKSFDNDKFVLDIFTKILSGDFSEFTKKEKNGYTIKEVKERMGEMPFTLMYNEKTKQLDTIFSKKEVDLSEIHEIYFEEEWVFNEDNLNFDKKIDTWTPIRVYHRVNDFKKEDTRYKKIFQIKNDNNSDFKDKIAKDYIYTFNFSQEYQNRTGLDKTEFFKFILQKIKEGKIKTYDPIYLVDKSKREFNIVELKNYAGISLDYIEFADEVDKLIFIEDWYFDEKTFSISKKVKGLGFIADRYNDEWEEKILFFIFFE